MGARDAPEIAEWTLGHLSPTHCAYCVYLEVRGTQELCSEHGRTAGWG